MIIVLGWAYSTLPPLLGLLQLGRQNNPFGTATRVTPAEAHLGTVLAVGVAALCFGLILTHLHEAPTSGLWRLAALLGPWVAIEIVSAVGAGYYAGKQFLLYPLVAVALWLVAPPLRVLATLGALTLGTAAFSLFFGLSSHLAFVDAGPAGVDKSIIGHGPLLLAGPYNASNDLGLALALGAPSILFLQSRRMRLLGFAVTAVALLWAAGRTSILAAAAFGLVFAVSSVSSATVLRRVGVSVVACGVALVCWTPFWEKNPLAFSQRGMVWLASRAVWHAHFWLGAGPQYYERPNALGFYALYGHNLVLDTIVRGGIVGVIALAIWFVSLFSKSIRLLRVNVFPILFLVSLVFASWLEVPIPFDNMRFIGYASWIPISVIVFASEGRAAERVTASEHEPSGGWLSGPLAGSGAGSLRVRGAG